MRHQLSALIRRTLVAIQDPTDVTFSYDRDSDSLMVHFFGDPRPTVSIPIDDPVDALYIRLNLAADEVIGLQIEGFVPHHYSSSRLGGVPLDRLPPTSVGGHPRSPRSHT